MSLKIVREEGGLGETMQTIYKTRSESKKVKLTKDQQLTWEEIQRIQAKRKAIIDEHRKNHWRSNVIAKRENLIDGCFRLLEEISPLDFYQQIFRVADEKGLMGEKGDITVKGQYTAIYKSIPIGDDCKPMHKKTKRRSVTAGCYEVKDLLWEDDDKECFTEDTYYPGRPEACTYHRRVGEKAFSIMSPILFAGKKATGENARWLCAIAIDLDYIYTANGQPQGLYNLLADCETGEIPEPTMIVCSGHGLHAYYVLEEPIPLFKQNKTALDGLRRGLIRHLWKPGMGICDLPHGMQDIQYESLTQCFRMPGTLTKEGYKATDNQLGRDLTWFDGRNYYTHAFWLKNRKTWTVNELRTWVADSPKTLLTMYVPKKNSRSFEELLELYPDWTRRHFYTDPKSKHYRKRRPPSAILQPKNAKTHAGWTCKRALYEWWLRRAEEVKNGHRYHFCLCLAAYAQKCGVSKTEFEKDVDSLYDLFSSKDTEESKWGDGAAEDAKRCIDSPYLYRFTIDRIMNYSGLLIQKKQRNGHTREEHLKFARFMKQGHKMIGDPVNEGRPSKENIVYVWRQEHPEGTKAACARDTKLDPKTIRKWWDFSPQPEADGYDFEEKKEVILKKL